MDKKVKRQKSDVELLLDEVKKKMAAIMTKINKIYQFDHK